VKQLELRARDGSVRALALVDDDVFVEVSGVRWHLHGEGYACRNVGVAGRTLLLHRVILGLEHGDPRQGDHKNRDRLDCQRANLRILPPGGNSQNTGARTWGRSRFRGVSPHKQSGRWQATVHGHHVGLFDDELAAAVAAEGRRREVYPFAEPDPMLVAALVELEGVAA
jgi:hypothetical protein